MDLSWGKFGIRYDTLGTCAAGEKEKIKRGSWIMCEAKKIDWKR